MLEIKHLRVAYRRRPILQNVSFTAKAGEITVLLGQNGCGKSTLLHTVMGEIAADGEILLNGLSLLSFTPRTRATRVSLLPQQLPAPAHTVRETVAMGLAPHTAHLGDAEWKKVEEKMALLGIAPLAERIVSTLSGGERQKVFLALLLVQDAPVLLLDEPATYTDAPFTALLFDTLRAERDKGKTVLAVMHDVGAALELADRIIVLENGSVAFNGTPAEALAGEVPEKHFGLTRYTAERDGKTAYFFR